MDDTNKNRYRLLFQDSTFAEVLSSFGFFATYYPTGESIVSDLWPTQGLKSEEFGKDFRWIQKVHPEDRERIRASAGAVYRGDKHSYEEEFRLHSENGSYRRVVTRGKTVAVNSEGGPVLFVGVDTDVSRFKSQEEAHLQQQNANLETLQEVAAIIGSSLDLQETVHRILEHTQRIIPYDTATVQLLEDGELHVVGGFGFEDIKEIMKLRFPYPETGNLTTEVIDGQMPRMSPDVTHEFPTFLQPKRGQTIRSWIGIPLIRHGEVIGLMTVDSLYCNVYNQSHVKLAATISNHIAIALENARLHDRTYHMAMSDGLTQIGSRRRFEVEGRLLYENAQRTDHPVAALMVDIDHFKLVNDHHGHDAGDKILQRVAEACGRDLRGSDLLARYGGEEFVVLLPKTNAQKAPAAAERIRSRVEKMSHPEIGGSVTVSIGAAAEVPHNAAGFEQLIKRADHALYQAKENGRNRVVVVD